MKKFANMFHLEMYKDDGNTLNKFHQIPMHTFLEIGLHFLQSVSIFLKICASVGQDILWGDA